MSKASKLDRMRTTVLETTGLTYTPGGTIELNFTPDVTNSGVSVPLVTGGSSSVGVCSLFTNYTSVGGPGLGCPYAQIIDHQGATVVPGFFYSYNSNTLDRRYIGGNDIGGFSIKWRVRDIQTVVIDEIGVSGPFPAGTISGDGKGNYFNLPLGVYHTDLTINSAMNNNSMAALYDADQTKLILSTFVNTFSLETNIFGSTLTHLEGVFEITNPNNKIIVINCCQKNASQLGGYGLGVPNGLQSSNLGNPFGNIYLNLQLWKIR